MPKIRTQADRRKHATFIDQHGRKWSAVIEKDTMHPAAAATPKGWKEPDGCVVPETFKTYPQPDDPFAMVINYDEWIQQLEEAQEAFYTSCSNTAMHMHPDDNGASLFRISEEGSVFISPALRRIVGKEPAPVDLVKAMRKGNKWSLGLLNAATGRPYPRPQWAEKFFPVAVVEQNAYPDEYEDELEDEGFEDAADEDQFPDEPADRLEEDDDTASVPQAGGPDDDDPMAALEQIAAPKKAAPAPPQKKAAPKKPAPKPAAKPATAS